jgi:hypothetical protein
VGRYVIPIFVFVIVAIAVAIVIAIVAIVAIAIAIAIAVVAIVSLAFLALIDCKDMLAVVVALFTFLRRFRTVVVSFASLASSYRSL